MPIIFNGNTFNNGGTIYFNGTSLSSVYFGETEVWKRSVTCTDLVNWNGWSTGGAVNQGAEGTAGAYTGSQMVSGTSTGRSNGRMYQNISMVAGHKYWLFFGTYTIDRTAVNTPLGNFSFGNGSQTTSQIVTYTGSTGSAQVSASYAGSDNTGSSYSRLCSMNIVDLTASFGSGNEPTAQWCQTNLGIFNGSKTVTPE